jgi:bifunctional DNA-binding transcriptional regulator/antitoxin component of YhaV-PrlF toxin-antitoxin module
MKNTAEIHSEIAERKIKIENLQRQVNSLLEIDDKGRATVPKENKERGAQIGKALVELRRKNEIDIDRLEKIQEISTKFNLSEDEIHILHRSIPTLERQISDLETIIESHKTLYKDTYERQRNSTHSPFFQQEALLKQSRAALDNHIKARAIVETLMRSK